jgi:hypothetical protein
MLLVIVALALLASVPIAGGRLGKLADIRLRAVWAVLLSAAIQIGITSAARGGSHTVHAILHLISYAFAAWFLVANRRLPGMAGVALGTGLNLLAITVNGGVMPASASAVRIAGIHTSGGFANSAPLTHSHLAFLGDVIPVPGPQPIGNILSVGDLVIFIGALLILHCACESRLAPRLRPRSIRRAPRIARAPGP